MGKSIWVSLFPFLASCAEEIGVHQERELQTVEALKGSNDVVRALVPKYPDHFRFVKAQHGVTCMSLVNWTEEFAVSALKKRNAESRVSTDGYRRFRGGGRAAAVAVSFLMSFPRGYEAQKKVKTWMDDFRKFALHFAI